MKWDPRILGLVDGKGLTLSGNKLGVAQKGVVPKLIYFKSIESQ